MQWRILGFLKAICRIKVISVTHVQSSKNRQCVSLQMMGFGIQQHPWPPGSTNNFWRTTCWLPLHYRKYKRTRYILQHKHSVKLGKEQASSISLVFITKVRNLVNKTFTAGTKTRCACPYNLRAILVASSASSKKQTAAPLYVIKGTSWVGGRFLLDLYKTIKNKNKNQELGYIRGQEFISSYFIISNLSFKGQWASAEIKTLVGHISEGPDGITILSGSK